MALYCRVRKTENGYIAALPSGDIPVQDDLRILDYFACGGSMRDFLCNAQNLGPDLSEIDGLLETVEEQLAEIDRGGDLLI